MLYLLHDMTHAALTPARWVAEMTKNMASGPFSPFGATAVGRSIAGAAEMFERMTRHFGKPEFGLHHTVIDGKKVEITEEIQIEKPFCDLLHFKRKTNRKDPKVLVVAPISGHYATLLRGTVEALLPHHDVYITDWEDARQVPVSAGRFNLDDYVSYLIDFLNHLGPDTHMIAVCQPAVPVFMATCVLQATKEAVSPASITLMGGPIDPRVSKTTVTELAEQRPLSWFEQSLISEVPFYYPGANRRVYPGFIQLGGFISMNMNRHVDAHFKFFQHLVRGDGGSAETHRTFYNEYLAVMDLPAEFYLQTVELVFQKHLLPKGLMKWKDPHTGVLHDVDPLAIKTTSILTVEGELDDISARGQTEAVHPITASLPKDRHFHHLQMGVGHYGIFNGRKWREQIMPRVRSFIRSQSTGKYDALPKSDLEQIPDIKATIWGPSDLMRKYKVG